MFGIVDFGGYQVDSSGAATEKPVPAVDNSNELCATVSGADPVECGSGDPPISGGASGEAVNSGKDEAALAAPVSAPIAEGCCFFSLLSLHVQICRLWVW